MGKLRNKMNFCVAKQLSVIYLCIFLETIPYDLNFWRSNIGKYHVQNE